MNYYEIDERIARAAKSANSFSDYIANSATEDYQRQCDKVQALANEVIEARPEEAERVNYYVDKFCKKYAQYINDSNRNEASCPSIMICGAGNFPVRKKEKQNNRRDKLMQEYQYIMGIKDKIKDIQYGEHIIKSGDEDVIEKLQEKIENLTALQNEMKQANAHYRKHKTMQGYGTYTDEEALKVDEEIKNDYSWAQQPYASFILTNNNAKIKNTQDRLNSILKAKSKPQEESTTAEYSFKIIRNSDIMRLQLLFKGKPSDEVRSLLKSNGFKWSPNNSAWQRQLTPNAEYSLNRILPKLQELTA